VTYTQGVRRTPNYTDRYVTFSRSCDQGKIPKLIQRYYRCSIDFLSQISKLSYFNVLDLSDFLMHHHLPVFISWR